MAQRKTWLTTAAWLLTPLLLAAVLVTGWHGPQAAVYDTVRQVNRWRTAASVEQYLTLEGTHFTVRYEAQDKNVAPVVLKVAEQLYPSLVQTMHFTPPDRVTLVIYPDRETLRQAFGWSDQESAVGVYWAGTISLLSPNVWLGDLPAAQAERAFYRYGPLAHEFTHLALDYRTSGNYPHWFSEGLAQWVEHKLTGYLWLEPDNRLDQPRYTLDQLDKNFDQLPNVAMAYRESYLLVDYLAQQGGPDSIGRLVDRLAQGESLQTAVQRSYGIRWGDLDNRFEAWLQANAATLDARPPQAPPTR